MRKTFALKALNHRHTAPADCESKNIEKILSLLADIISTNEARDGQWGGCSAFAFAIMDALDARHSPLEDLTLCCLAPLDDSKDIGKTIEKIETQDFLIDHVFLRIEEDLYFDSEGFKSSEKIIENSDFNESQAITMISKKCIQEHIDNDLLYWDDPLYKRVKNMIKSIERSR